MFRGQLQRHVMQNLVFAIPNTPDSYTFGESCRKQGRASEYHMQRFASLANQKLQSIPGVSASTLAVVENGQHDSVPALFKWAY
jgi:hypothetical protein